MSDRWYTQPFTLTDEHRRLAARLNITWQPDMEWRAVEDEKEPR